MTNFDQSKHPRTAAGTSKGGQFAEKQNSAPEVALTPATSGYLLSGDDLIELNDVLTEFLENRGLDVELADDLAYAVSDKLDSATHSGVNAKPTSAPQSNEDALRTLNREVEAHRVALDTLEKAALRLELVAFGDDVRETTPSATSVEVLGEIVSEGYGSSRCYFTVEQTLDSNGTALPLDEVDAERMSESLNELLLQPIDFYEHELQSFEPIDDLLFRAQIRI